MTASVNNTDPNVGVVPWGDKVKLLAGSEDNATSTILRTFDRAEFDAWLLEIAYFGGLG